MFKKCGTEPRGSIQRKDRDRPSWIYTFVTTLLSQRHLIMKSRAHSAKDHSFFSLTNEQYQIKGTVALQLSISMLRYLKGCLIVSFFHSISLKFLRLGLKPFATFWWSFSSCPSALSRPLQDLYSSIDISGRCKAICSCTCFPQTGSGVSSHI